MPPALHREESPASCLSLLPAPSLVEPGCLGGIEGVCQGGFNERRGSEVEHSHPGGSGEACRGLVVETLLSNEFVTEPPVPIP